MFFLKIRSVLFGLSALLLSKIFFVDMPPILSVMAIITDDEGRILFQELTYLKGLGIPGGLVKGHETIEDALARELLEETGLNIKTFSLCGSVCSATLGIPTITVVYKVDVTGQQINLKEGKLLWLSPKEAIERLAYESAKMALRKYILSE